MEDILNKRKMFDTSIEEMLSQILPVGLNIFHKFNSGNYEKL
jgi:hypothetical protein